MSWFTDIQNAIALAGYQLDPVWEGTCYRTNRCLDGWVNPATTSIFCMDETPFGQEGADTLTCNGTVSCCGVGCIGCDDQPGHWALRGVIKGHGHRFLRAYQGYTPARANRDAKGYLHDLRSGVPRRVPAGCTYLLSPIYRNDYAYECINDACVFSPDADEILTDVEPCQDCGCAHGESIGESIRDFYTSCFFFSGHREPNPEGGYVNGYDCRCSEERDKASVVTVPNMQEYLNQSVFFRSGKSKPTTHGQNDNVGLYCTANALVGAIGRVTGVNPGGGFNGGGITCLGSYAREPLNDNDPLSPYNIYYNQSNQQRAFFDRMLLDWSDVSVTTPDDLPTTTWGALSNAVIKTIENNELPGEPATNVSSVKFDQLDREFGDPVTGSYKIDTWSRHYNQGLAVTERVLPPTLLRVPAPLTARLRPGGTMLEVDLVIVRASMRCNYVAHTVFEQDRFTSQRFIEPHVRLKLQAAIAIMLRNGTHEETYVRSWLPEGDVNREVDLQVLQVDPYDDDNYVPMGKVAIGDSGTSKVEFFWEGEPLPYVHRNVVWEGHLGAFSSPTSEQQRKQWIGDWGDLARALTNVRVPGRPDYSETFAEAASWTYTGTIGLSFNVPNINAAGAISFGNIRRDRREPD